jgi:hypothetical protein
LLFHGDGRFAFLAAFGSGRIIFIASGKMLFGHTTA